MSFLFKFIDSGFLLTLGLVLLVSGGIMLYCYRRLNLLEKSLIEHGKILQNFIINYNMQMQHFSLANNSIHNNKSNNTISNDEIIKTEYVEFDKVKKINLGEKISVSDDEDDEDDEDDVEDEDEDDVEDEDEDDDVDDEDEDEAVSENEDEDEAVSENEDLDVLEYENMDTLAISNNKLEEDLDELENVESITTLENVTLNEQSISTIDDETFLKNLPINLTSFTLENTNNNPKIINLEENTNLDTKPGDKKNYSKMKVDDLKSLVVTRNLTDNETAQKMKKSDLVKLLQN